MDPEIPHRPTCDVRQRERDWTTVAIFSRAGSKVRPPGLAVTVDPAGIVSVDEEVVTGDDEPGRLGLDEDDTEGVRGIHPERKVEDELREKMVTSSMGG